MFTRLLKPGRGAVLLGGGLAGFYLGGTTILLAEEVKERLPVISTQKSPALKSETAVSTQQDLAFAVLKTKIFADSPDSTGTSPDEDEEALGGGEEEEEAVVEASRNLYIPASDHSAFTIFSGNANERLANEVAMLLGMQLGRAKVDRFADGEVNILMLDNVRGKDCFVIQSLSRPVNESVMDLLLMISCLRRASARRITAVIPYFAYSRTRDPADRDSRPVAAADLAKMLTVAGIDRVVLVDVHSKQVLGFFGLTPADDLDVSGVAAEYFDFQRLRDPVVVSPDHDGVQRANRFRDLLLTNGQADVSLAVVVDQRVNKSAPSVDFDKEYDLVGEVAGRDCIIRDDIGETGQRIVYAAEKLKRCGAKRVFAFITHPLFTDEAFDLIEECSSLEEVVCLNTVPLQRMSPKVRQLSVGWLLAESLRRIHESRSVSALFVGDKELEKLQSEVT